MATTKAQAAIRAAKNYDRLGGHAAVTYASRRGVSITMLCIALGVEQRRTKRAQGGAA